MVDVDSALRASAYSGKKRKGGPGTTEKASTELEPFDPSHHAQKEKADAVSMWLVIFFGALVATSMRYLLMPTMDNSEQVLWLLPVLLIGLVRPLHRVLIPSGIFEIYTGGNWFRASFLYLFTWLALSFIVANPPLADVAAPALASGLDIEETEGVETIKWKSGALQIGLNQDNVDIVLGMGVRDNIDVESANITVSIWKGNSQVDENTLLNIESVTVGSLTEAMDTFDEVNGSWSRGQLRNTLTRDFIGPKVAPLTTDYGLAWDLGQLGPGEYNVRITLEEDGSPWKGGLNTWSATYQLIITQVA